MIDENVTQEADVGSYVIQVTLSDVNALQSEESSFQIDIVSEETDDY